MGCFQAIGEVGMLRLRGGRVEGGWGGVLPERLRELPEGLAQIDGLLRDEALLAPIEAHWEREAQGAGPLGEGGRAGRRS